MRRSYEACAFSFLRAFSSAVSATGAAASFFGAPSSEKEVSEESFEKAKIGRYATVWNFDNVEVSVVLYSIQGTMRVIERWDLKSDAARHAQRPDAKPVHGSGIKPTPNPHIKRTEST